MDIAGKEKLRAFLKETLAKHGDTAALSDSDSIFVSGRLDSFSMMMLVMELEESFGIDFSKVDFEVGYVDSIADIEAFIDTNQPDF
jgi:acyl carrier protein